MSEQTDSSDGLVLVAGDAPLVVYAPHGGRRDPGAGRGASVNDLHSDSMALEIARRLGASAVVNRGIDRNEFDLNRISTLKTARGDVLARLERAVATASRDASRPALVLLVHGWNVSAPWCDVGVGLTESGGELRGRNPTVSRDVYARLCVRLIDGLRGAGMAASTGHRYAASGAENVTQLFSGRHVGDDDPVVSRLSRLALDGKLDGVQVELGIPLRWPGARRDDFLEILCDVVASDLRAREDTQRSLRSRAEWSLQPRRIDRPRDRPEAGYALQAVLDDGSGLFLGAEPGGARSMAARICLARPDGVMSLFVSEGPWDGRVGEYRVAGLCFDAEARAPAEDDGHTDSSDAQAAPAVVDVVRPFDAGLRYEGPVVRYPTHEAFLDLERGLAGATIEEASIELSFAHRSGGFGSLAGRIDIGGARIAVDATAVCSRGSRLDPAARSRLRVHITDGPHAPSAVAAALSADGREIVARPHVGGELRGEVLSRVPVYRTLPGGGAIRVTFGVVAFRSSNGETSRGLFEDVAILPSPTDTDRSRR